MSESNKQLLPCSFCWSGIRCSLAESYGYNQKVSAGAEVISTLRVHPLSKLANVAVDRTKAITDGWLEVSSLTHGHLHVLLTTGQFASSREEGGGGGGGGVGGGA